MSIIIEINTIGKFPKAVLNRNNFYIVIHKYVKYFIDILYVEYFTGDI